MTFGAPYWLWALALLPVLVFLFVANERRRNVLLQKLVAARLLPNLAASISPVKRRLRFGLLLAGLGSIIASLAQPCVGYTWEQSKHKGLDVLIAIDTSKSMLSTDVAPNRLTRAKLAAQDLLADLPGDRVGVLAFAGESLLVAPLTIDYSAVLDSLNDIDTNIVPRGGTDIASVINGAAKAFGKGESENRCLILFTDGEELDEDGLAAAKAQAGNFRIFTVGVGTAEGSLIPVPEDDGGTAFTKDTDGQIVKSKLDETRLTQIADATNGFYTHLQNGQADMKKIVEQGLGKLQERDIETRMSRKPIERYQWPLSLGLLLITVSMLVGERRRSPAPAKRNFAVARTALFAFALFGAVNSSKAATLNNGVTQYNDQQYKDAYETFNKQLLHNRDSQALEFDSGAAAYKSGDYEKAIESFGRASTSSEPGVRGIAEYNLGNTLCLRGVKQEKEDDKLADWKNAIQHYDEALKVDPKNENAKYNRDIVEKLIEELKKKQQQQQQQQDKDQKSDKDKKQDKNQQNKNSQSQKDQDKDKQKDQKDQNQQQKDQQSQGNGNDQQQQQQQSQNGSQDQKQNQGQGKQDQSQNGQNQQQQNQQQSQGGKDQQHKDQQQQQSQGNGQQKDQQDQSAQNQQGQQGKGQQKDQNQQPQQQPGNDNGQSGDKQQQQQQGQPSPTPGSDDGKEQQAKNGPGQIQTANQQKGQDQQGASGAAEQPYVPGQERAMTPEEARRVVEAEKGEEVKGVLIEHKSSAPVLKDW